MVKFLDKSKVDFIVKEDEGVVVARFANPEDLSYRIAEKIANLKLGFYISNKDVKSLIDRVSTVRGVAKCAPEDTFDIKIGKRIALSHLKNKTTKSILKLIERYLLILDAEHDRLATMFEDGTNFLIAENDRLIRIYEDIGN